MEFKKIFISDKVSLTKRQAKTRLVNKWKQSLLGVLPLYLLWCIIPMVALLDWKFDLNTNPLIYLSLSIIAGVITAPIMYGVCMIFLKNTRGREWKSNVVFRGFHHFGKSFRLSFWICVECFLGSIPLILATLFASQYIKDVKIFEWTFGNLLLGVICILTALILGLAMPMYIFIRYSQAFFLIIDCRNIKVKSAIGVSVKLMKWNEKRMLYLILSFSGWIISIVFLFILLCIGFFFVKNAIVSMTYMITCAICLVLTGSFITVYILSSFAVFYDKLIGELPQKDSVVLFDETITI